MQWILKKIIGTKNERDLKKYWPTVAEIREQEKPLAQLDEAALKGKTDEFRKRLEDGETTDDLLCEAYAVVVEACRRLCGTYADVCGHEQEWNMVPFDVQLIGGVALHRGTIAEMATGEGKTLVATLPVYLNALTGRGVHVVTVNDYLARRDAQWMAHLYTYLGLTVGCIQNAMMPDERRAQYACDITYGTNSEFGFDYLRDNGMAYRASDMVQRGHFFAIIDEIDSILIDEARTPLIISGPAQHSSTEQFRDLKPHVERLVRRQRDLCNKLMDQARKKLAANEDEEAMRLLYQVHQGMPKHKQLMRLLEDPVPRRLLEKVEGMMLTDMHKEEGRELREELYFNIDEKGHDASLTEKGSATMNPKDPEAYTLPDLVGALSELDGDTEISDDERFRRTQVLQQAFTDRSESIHCVDQLIRAFTVYERDVQYVVQENQVMIVDEFTGRLMPGRRWSDGLHQAIEAKEGVRIERETQTLATITIQNYFRMYDKLSGMTGTAETEADEFHQIYKLEVLVIPTNRPVRRVDFNDCVYRSQREKYNAIIDEVAACHQRGQPVLVGTVSVDVSEVISRMLKRKGIPHSVLNAKNHEGEAEIVSRAGQPGGVTIATNMAGRGTDIKLGKGVVAIERKVVESQLALKDAYRDGKTLLQELSENPCGLFVIGSSRHESRRIDRQLRGRCARQGDPGSSRFYVSLEDNLMRLFGSDRIARIMERLGIEEGEVLEHPWLNRSIETAQRRVEQHNFSIRKRTLEYDDVMNKQREVIYDFRREVVGGDTVRELLYEISEEAVAVQVDLLVSDPEDQALEHFLEWVNMSFPIGLRLEDIEPNKKDAEAMTTQVCKAIRRAYELKVQVEDGERLEHLERHVILTAIDTHWQEYLRAMDALREGVGLRAYGQRDPLVEYKREAFTMFSDLMDRIKDDIVNAMFRASSSMEAFERMMAALPQAYVHDEVNVLGAGGAPAQAGSPAAGEPAPGAEDAFDAGLRAAEQPVRREGAKVGRNDPCPCGSGKKYKKCCGQ